VRGPCGGGQEEPTARRRFHSWGSSSPMRKLGYACTRRSTSARYCSGVNAVGLAGGHQGVEASQVLARGLVAGEEEFLAAQGHLAQGAFAAVVVQRQALIRDETGSVAASASSPDAWGGPRAGARLAPAMGHLRCFTMASVCGFPKITIFGLPRLPLSQPHAARNYLFAIMPSLPAPQHRGV
jgi:hypothetical protein